MAGDGERTNNADDGLVLGGEFPPTEYAAWREAASKALGGADPEERLKTRTYEGFELRPLYTRERHAADDDPAGLPGATPFTRGAAAALPAGGWQTRQLVADADPDVAAASVRRELARGVEAVLLRLDRAARTARDPRDDGADRLVAVDGIAAHAIDDLDRILADADLARTFVALDAGATGPAAGAALMALWRRRGIAPADAHGALGIDPLGALAAGGRLAGGLDANLAAMAALAGEAAAGWPGVTAVGVDGEPYASAGGSESQELACVLAAAVEYLRAMTDAGLSVDAACRQIAVTLSLGPDQFLGIAKLRAARRLWSRVTEVAGATDEARALRVGARTGVRAMSQRDPHVNVLRATLACFAGAVGGAEWITVLPYDAALGGGDQLARRIARNTQHVLREESSLARVIDPAGGSWFVEDLTRRLAETAWARFQEIERAGGLGQALRDGTLAGMLEATWSERRRRLALRRDPLTGVSEFPNLDEPLPEPAATDPEAVAARARERLRDIAKADLPAADDPQPGERLVAAADGGASFARIVAALGPDTLVIDPLPAHRFAEEFEALRDASDACAARTGERPRIFLANIGRIAQFTARATFARNLFAAGGVAAVGEDGFEDAAAAAEAFRNSGLRMACICGSDAQYGTHAAAVARALRDAGCERVFLAGNPGERREELEAAGVDAFIHVGSDALEILRDTVERLTAGV